MAFAARLGFSRHANLEFMAAVAGRAGAIREVGIDAPDAGVGPAVGVEFDAGGELVLVPGLFQIGAGQLLSLGQEEMIGNLLRVLFPFDHAGVILTRHEAQHRLVAGQRLGRDDSIRQARRAARQFFHLGLQTPRAFLGQRGLGVLQQLAGVLGKFRAVGEHLRHRDRRSVALHAAADRGLAALDKLTQKIVQGTDELSGLRMMADLKFVADLGVAFIAVRKRT